MSKIPTSQEKIQQLCDALERDALKPAQEKSERIIAKAQDEASQIIEKAKKEAKQIEENARQEAKRSQSTLEGALNAAARQALTKLRKEIESKLLNASTAELVSKALSQEEMIVSSLKSLFQALATEGLSGKSLHVLLDENLDQQKVLESVVGHAGKSLKEGLTIGAGQGRGIVLKLEGEKISIDCSEEAVSQLFCQFLRPAFREKFFSSSVAT